MELKKINTYKVSEHTVLNETDEKHIANYQQLIKFFENALQSSIKDGKVDYNALHNSCLQSIRYLDSLILSYEGAVQGVRMVNATIDKIINDSKNVEKLGNEEKY
jgi:uncharacterized protein